MYSSIPDLTITGSGTTATGNSFSANTAIEESTVIIGAVVSSSYAVTSSYAAVAGNSAPSVSASYAVTASYAASVLSSSYADTALTVEKITKISSSVADVIELHNSIEPAPGKNIDIGNFGAINPINSVQATSVYGETVYTDTLDIRDASVITANAPIVGTLQGTASYSTNSATATSSSYSSTVERITKISSSAGDVIELHNSIEPVVGTTIDIGNFGSTNPINSVQATSVQGTTVATDTLDILNASVITANAPIAGTLRGTADTSSYGLMASGLSLDDFDRYTQGGGRLYGGGITSNGNGTVAITSGAGIAKTQTGSLSECVCALTSSNLAPNRFVTWNDVASLALTDNAYNYIYYNGTNNAIQATTDFYSIDFYRDFTLGRAYRTGNNVVTRLCGTNLWNFNRRVQLFGEERFPVERARGMVLSGTGTRNISVTAGILWAELVNRFTTTAVDTSAGGTFTAWYISASAYTSSTNQTQISNTQYNNTTTGLVNFGAGPGHYGVHFVYVVHDSTVHSVYGTSDYTTLASAQAAGTPATLPGLLSSYATLVGRIIIQKDATSFVEVDSAFDTTFNASTVSSHNDLGGLQGGTTSQYYHLTSASYAQLSNGSASYAITASYALNGGTGGGGSLSTGSSYPITSSWANNLTITSSAQTTGSYTLVAGDYGKVITFTNATTNSIVIPSGLPTNFNVVLVSISTGSVLVTGSGVALYNANNSYRLSSRYAMAYLVGYLPDSYILSGDTSI